MNGYAPENRNFWEYKNALNGYAPEKWPSERVCSGIRSK